MYGQIHLCIRSLVLAKFGEDKWKQILTHSTCDDIDDFRTFHCYHDSKTLTLLQSVQHVIGIPLEDVLDLFGEHFFIYCYQNGYDKMLKTLGDNFKTFVQNLDSLHSLLAFTYKNINAPSFRCEDGENDTLILHYYSMRPGLHHIVTGLCRSVGREMFNQNVTVEIINQDIITLKDNKVMHSTIFRVIFNKMPTSDHEIFLEKKRSSRTQTSELKYCMPSEQLISCENFCQIFPFHIIFNKDLVIQQCGVNILRWTEVTSTENIKLKDWFVLIKPEMELTFENIERFQNSNYILENRDKNEKVLLKLRGQMVILSDVNLVLFIGSPRLSSIEEMEDRNMFLCDIPLYDVTREFVLLYQQRSAEFEVSKKLDETTAELKKTAKALDQEKAKTEILLYRMLPKKVVHQLKEGKRVDAERFEEVTILFSDIVTFTNIASAVSPIQIVSMLNDMYTRFDQLTETHNVYKVETIGDAYMIVAGCPEVSTHHAEYIADFSLDMIVAARQVMSPASGEPLQIRVGFHSGPVVAGVVGDKMPRYCLFGDTVNTSSRMESHGAPGKIHLSPSAYKKLAGNPKYVIESRGNIEIKGKGTMTTYWIRGFADGSRWNNEYDGTTIIETSSYEYYEKHGLPKHSPAKRVSFSESVTVSPESSTVSPHSSHNKSNTGCAKEECKGELSTATGPKGSTSCTLL